ncbi:DUF4087 domain-containing protein [Tabrizicola aquatica]|uniref:DUF4087 domain-containing protein n=1 Tax=Tabrizicola aquatica TaxID=909926 RepID=UPI0015E1B584|nr:DUF4087 domain-containing protein [Tabrizicola aquatica]
MLRPVLLTAALLAALPAGAETRCGWYHNPTPANVILEDADGQWWLSMQGGPAAPGFEDAYTTAFDNRLRIDYAGQVTQRYGYSCACAEGEFDASRGQYDNVISIRSLKEIPLARCEQDAALPPP